MLVIDLPYPNSANQHWRMGRGRMYLSSKGVAFREAVKMVAKIHNQKAPEGRLQISVMLYPRDKRVRDIDNVCKALNDALVHAGIIEDDSLIDKLIIERGAICKGGKCRVYISEYK